MPVAWSCQWSYSSGACSPPDPSEKVVALPLVTIVTFLAAALAVAGAYSVVSDLFLRDRLRVNRRVEAEFLAGRTGRVQKSALFKDLGKLAAEAGTFERPGRSPRRWLEEAVEQSGMDLTVSRLLLIGALCWLVVAVGIAFVSGKPALGVAAGLAASLAPIGYVHIVRKRRLDKILGQLPDALDLMARSVRAGQTMSQALQAIADEFTAPIGPEFAFCYEQQNLGLSPEVAYQEMARRTGMLEIKIFVLAMGVQRQTGGNLAELLEKLATVVRDRFRIRGRIRVLTAEGRIQAVVLLAMPPVIFLMMLFINPGYTGVLLEHPRALAGLGVSMGIGTLWIRRIVNFDF